MLARLLPILGLTVGAFAQDTSAVVAAGYFPPTPVSVAPGQIVTLFARGVGTAINQPLRAMALPLPTTLGGVSVALRQAVNPNQAIPVPILSISKMGGCASSVLERQVPCSSFTAITVHTPFDLVPNTPGTLIPANDGIFVVSENGINADAIPILPQPDQVHIFTTCEAAAANCSTRTPLITHSDGTLVSSANPARSGETVVAYALGLGLTQPRVASGDAADVAARVVVAVGFDFRANAAPSIPLFSRQQPVYAGTTPGAVGLYQINFQIPPLPEDTPPCSGTVKSNLTVTVQGATSFDGAGVCVAR